MNYTDVIILIPSHSLEDFPTEQGENPAAGLLNSFAVAWHPQWLANMAQLPRWHRADDPPRPSPGQLVFVPEVCEGWLPHGWVEEARAAEAIVIDQLHDRSEMMAAALAPLDPQELDAELVADFLALGSCWLQVELLTRHMRNFGNIDEIRFQNRVIAAARSVVAHDRETAVAHLQASFEILLEAREKFYPVDCYLLDLCLVIPETVDDQFAHFGEPGAPLNVMISGKDLAAIHEQRPELVAGLKAGVASGRVGLVGGELTEASVPVTSMASSLAQWRAGAETFQRLLHAVPRVWGRRRFGLSPVWPQILKQSGYVGALHVVLDDGIYPDAEHSRFRWQGCAESVVEAFSRIPLAADSAVSWLRFPQRLAESMDNDHVAGICFARWPEIKAPWLRDLHRAERYAPVLGKFVTFAQFFQTSGGPGRVMTYHGGEYFTPFLLQHVARRDADPLSRYADHTRRRLAFDAANWCRGMAAALRGQPVQSAAERELEQLVESFDADREPTADPTPCETGLQAAEREWTRDLASILMSRAQAQSPGLLLMNPFRFPRRMTIPWSKSTAIPSVAGCVKSVDFPSGSDRGDITVDVPGCGFVWLATAPATAQPPEPPRKRGASVPVDEGVLLNERFEVSFNDATGGIAQVRHPQKRENRFSQLVSYRFPRERQVPAGPDEPPLKTQYAETRCLGKESRRTTGSTQEIVTFGDIIDQMTGRKLASFRQQTRLFRHRPVIEFDVELDDVSLPESDPWNQYFCVRFAWDSSSSVLTRSLLDGAHPIGGDRFEATQYVEVASEDERLTWIPYGLPFHRKTGPRMLDTLLIVPGESRRKFQFAVAVDHPYPLEAAWDATAPRYVLPTETGFAESGASGWLLHCDARNVQFLRWLDLVEPPADDAGARPPSGTSGFVCQLLETEGRRRAVRLQTFRNPIFARKVDLQGRTIDGASLEGDGVAFDMGPYELCQLELRFG